MEINIRLMNESDLDILAEVYCEAYRVFDVGERWEKDSARDLLAYWFKHQPDLAFVAEDDSKVIGAFIAGIKPWWNGNHLVDGEIFVHPDYQARGAGSRLLKVMFETAIEKYDADVWEALTFADHEFPLRWYKSLGFEPVKDLVLFSGDMKKALVRLSKKGF
ncbi:MAG TPA: GNAT family N-acetyltransferase [Patescibacteria group bacterium]